ncbi:ADP-ribosyl cyclase/cyclic ADP-ribose hydrolase 1 isoform X2 [Pygocentrus nattereri]|uniref:ADP-ribosyl cyclase/cyclic ADP-ribose hydrolase n=1 Tax=Pygocentrus nattereri TaxID=42514 RepID=A0AAR2JRU2_PYGNA|nr:ADP-ribosyl cyclase/cyclic ADP-ribose hydrolase 1 isoform X2 [Pygocentrus nattereri]
MISGLLTILFLIDHVSAGPGTTPNLKHIVIGRCYDYITLVKPSSRYNCEDIWREFEEAVVRRSPCSVRVKDYQRMFRATSQTLPCDKLLFWSKTRELMHSYAAVTGRFWTLEDTLVGFMFNDLVWCGQQERDRGFDFQSCPDWSACVTHPVYSLWNRASLNFAAAACGNITVLLNGSIGNAFNRKRESCSKGSILELISVLESRGFRWSCTDRDVTLMILQCMKNPKQSSCQSCSSSLLHRKSLHL